MKPLPKSCLISFLATLPVSAPVSFLVVAADYRLDLFLEFCVERLFNGAGPVDCGVDPIVIAQAIIFLVILVALISAPLFPFVFLIAYAVLQGRKERSEAGGQPYDRPASDGYPRTKWSG